MSSMKKLILAIALMATLSAAVPHEAQADGPLRRWWRHITGRDCGCQTQTVPQYTANYAAANPYNLQPGQCMKTCEQTCSRTVVNYVPQTAYRTVYKRVPVTQYRPVTNSDPCTGCTVTCMKPCTTYTYQCQRVPYTTYRPVYRQETYKVPVTTITNDCATGNCGVNTGCSTCATGVNPGYQTYPSYPANVPPTTSRTYLESPESMPSQGYQEPTPADLQPSLGGIANPQTTQRPVSYAPSTMVDPRASAPTPAYQQIRQPAYRNQNFGDQTARVERNLEPVRQAWSYSPMRLASSQTSVRVNRDRRIESAVSQVRSPSKSRWVEVGSR